MDLETENRIAAVLMKEAAELRRLAARDGIDAYLHPPNVRVRPNSRFLTATVLGVQQSNRAVEVNEMWRAREKEKEMDNRSKKDSGSKPKSTRRVEDYASSSNSAIKGELRDNEIEEFLHSRAKRGRGTVGSRMDETGPYLPDSEGYIDMGYRESRRAVLGPEKPHNLNSDDESSEERERKAKRSKHDRKRHKSSVDEKKKKKKEEKRTSTMQLTIEVQRFTMLNEIDVLKTSPSIVKHFELEHEVSNKPKWLLGCVNYESDFDDLPQDFDYEDEA
ncbi:uncharacterized protein LOC143557993 [Bidens hawaiensis]|uniref:uncharacterized protein LOC143557993 n=1 Tax=Bidens hawaiensis TaxID=980011 RepID=UPI004049FBD7